MIVKDILLITFFFCTVFLLAEFRHKSDLAAQPEVHCMESQNIYDDGYHHGYSDGIDDGTAYENANQFSQNLITDDQVENPKLYQNDTNPFE